MSGGQTLYGNKYYFYSFEVVCMTTKISVTETYRDAAVYRLSCTAKVFGGTAPYTYSWLVLGSRTTQGQGTATITAEFPISTAGSVDVSVRDSGNPQCSASDIFSVCGMTCDFTTALVSTPFPPATSPYLYECQASVAGGTGPYFYEWSPAGSGQTARISMPDNKRRAIKLTVSDSRNPPCKAFKPHYVGMVQFEVFTDPPSSSPGIVPDNMAPGATRFYVTIVAKADGEVDNPPSTLVFELNRRKTGATSTLTANLTGFNPVKYEAKWDVTQEKGRWEIKTQNYISNTLQFKIDKRKQIVEVAKSWVGITKNEAVVAGVDYCNRFVAQVYGHVGLPIPSTVDAQYSATPIACSGDGCLLFFNIMQGPEGGPYSPRSPWNPQHVAIRIGGQRINADSFTQPTDADNRDLPSSGVASEAFDEGVYSNPPVYDPNIRSQSPGDLDED